jgi:hypothetical protein
MIEQGSKEAIEIMKNIIWNMLLPDKTEKACLGIPDKYRGIAKLIFDGKNITLYWNMRNC